MMKNNEIMPASGGRHDSIRYQSQLSIVIICHDKNIDIDIHWQHLYDVLILLMLFTLKISKADLFPNPIPLVSVTPISSLILHDPIEENRTHFPSSFADCHFAVQMLNFVSHYWSSFSFFLSFVFSGKTSREGAWTTIYCCVQDAAKLVG